MHLEVEDRQARLDRQPVRGFNDDCITVTKHDIGSAGRGQPTSSGLLMQSASQIPSTEDAIQGANLAQHPQEQLVREWEPLDHDSNTSKRKCPDMLQPGAKRQRGGKSGSEDHAASAGDTESSTILVSDDDDETGPDYRLWTHNEASLEQVREMDKRIDDDAIQNSLCVFITASDKSPVYIPSKCTIIPEALRSTQAKILLSVYQNNHWTLVVIPEARDGAQVYNWLVQPADTKIVEETITQIYNHVEAAAVDMNEQVSYTSPIQQRDDSSSGLILIFTGLCEILNEPVPQGTIHSELWREAIHLLLAPLTTEELAAIQSLSWESIESVSFALKPDYAEVILQQSLREFLRNMGQIEDKMEKDTKRSKRLLPPVEMFQKLLEQAHDNYRKLTEGDRASKRELEQVLEAALRIRRLIQNLHARSGYMEKARMLKGLTRQFKEFQVGPLVG